jgi:uncharacterized protein YuzE
MVNDNMGFRFHYDEEHDVLHIRNVDEEVEESVEFSEEIILDLNKERKVVGIEIFYVSELFSAFNKEIDKKFLSNLGEAKLEYKDFRNMWFIVLVLKSGSKQISQALPPLRKSEYTSPLIASYR